MKKKIGALCLLVTAIAAAPADFHAQQTFTFTTASATGSLGPTQTQVNSAYASTNLNGSVTIGPSQGIQQFTVPTTGPYRIEAWGAAGGTHMYSTGYPGGRGAYISGDFTLTAGTVLSIIVGQLGINTHSVLSTDWDNAGAGGGGGTFVYTLATSPAPFIAAGGGAGGGSISTPSLLNASGTTSANAAQAGAGAAGGVNGNGGQINTGGNSYWAGGGTGWLTDGTGGNQGTLYNYVGPSLGANGGRRPANGGAGGIRYNDLSDEGGDGGFGGGGGGGSDNMGSGGGGGYSGGGGANSGSSFLNYTGGGGGSYNGGINQVNTGGANTGDGKVIITQLCDVHINVAGASNSLAPVICAGQSLTLTTIASSNYSWSTGATTQSIVVTPASSSTISVTGTGALGCSGYSAISITVSPGVPTLAITSSTPATCLGNSVTINTSGALTYTYSSGISAGVAFIPPAGTNVYTVTGGNGCGTTTGTTTITISPLPIPVTASSTLICAGSPATITASGATTYTFAPGSSTLASTIVSPQSTTIYTVTGQTGSCTGTSTLAITTKPNPTLSIAANHTAICNGDQVTLNVTGNATTYTFTPGGPGTSISAFPANTTLYSVTGTNSVNCVSTAQQVIIVNPLPIVNATVSNPLVCSGGASTLAASGASTYAWTGGSNATTSVMVVNPITDQTYTVVGTSSLGCIASTVVGVTIFNPTISISSGTSICSGANTILNAGVADTYSWSNGTTTQNDPVSPTQTTTYTVNAMVNNLNGLSCPASNTVEVTVNPNPTISATANRTIICVGESATLTANGAGATGTYTFTGGAGAVVSSTNAVNPIGDQTYTITGIDANGCKGKATFNMVVAQCTGISVNPANNANLSVYPNPSNGEFTISADQAITLQITNELGQQIRTIVLDKNTTTVKVTNLSNGIYFISGKNENGSVKQKIVIAK